MSVEGDSRVGVDARAGGGKEWRFGLRVLVSNSSTRFTLITAVATSQCHSSKVETYAMMSFRWAPGLIAAAG